MVGITVHSLVDLKSGKLASASHIKIAEGLTEFPNELFALADTLEVLDLSSNQLTQLPDEFSGFKKLRRLFLSDNNFQTMPEVLSQCPKLEMIGFKANQIEFVPDASLPKTLRWLILTDNKIDQLPVSIGNCLPLQKLMLAGNQLTELPVELANCENLELIRISANRLQELPEWLVELPKLAWLAFSGNPCCGEHKEYTLDETHWDELQLGELLGEGASGLISKAYCQIRGDLALKEFKGAVTSDGLPHDEMNASIAAGEHFNVVNILGKLTGHPLRKSGLLMSLIADDYYNLAGPPSLESCSRDTYAEERVFSYNAVLLILQAIASAAAHLHQRKVMHGDLYGHNILVDPQYHCLLGDFGAASLYENQSADVQMLLHRVEVRAFACLLEELLDRINPQDSLDQVIDIDQLRHLQTACFSMDVAARPSFTAISYHLQTYSSKSV